MSAEGIVTSAPTRKRSADFRTQQLEAFDKSWRVATLPSGLTILHVPSHDAKLYLGVVIRAGTRLEVPNNNGVAHFLEHMMFRGSKRFPEFTKLAEAFEWLGGEWNAATGHEHTEYWYSGIATTAADVVDLFAEFLENPALNDMEIERNVVVRELEGEMNDHGLSTDLDHHAATLLWPQSTLALPIIGTKESIAGISLDTLRAYRDKFYTPKNMAVCLVGGDAKWDGLGLLEKFFAKHRTTFEKSPPTKFAAVKAQSEPAVKWVQHSDNEYEIKLAFACGGEWSEEAPILELLTRILSDGFTSRLGRRLREELGLVYHIEATTGLYHDVGTLDVNASCSQDQLDKFLTELFALLKKLREEGPGDEELERARIRAVVDLELSATHPELIGPRLAWAHLCGVKLELARERALLEKATVKDLAHVAKYLFRPERAALVAMGPSGGKDLEKKMKKMLVEGLA